MERKLKMKINNPMQDNNTKLKSLNSRKIIKEIKNQKILEDTLLSLPENIKQIIYASSIADGRLQRINNKNACLRLAHSFKQKDYLFWKSDIIAQYFGKYKIYEYKNRNLIVTTFKAHPYFTHIYKLIHDNNGNFSKKRLINPIIIQNLNWLGLGILYLDDGSLMKYKNACNIARKNLEDRNKINERLNNLGIKSNINSAAVYIPHPHCVNFINNIKKEIPLLSGISYKLNVINKSRFIR